MLCSWMSLSQRPGAVPQRGVREGVVLSATFTFTILHYDMISKVRARCYLRLNELYTALAAHAAVRPTCVRQE